MLQGLITLVGRLMLAAIFLASGANKLMDWSGTLAYMQQYGVPAAEVLIVLAVIVELGGALLLAVGFKARWGAAALLLFLIPTTYYFHDFWAVPQDQVQMQATQFLKNAAIFGGLLMAFAHGPGPWSVDARRRK